MEAPPALQRLYNFLFHKIMYTVFRTVPPFWRGEKE